MIDDVIGFIMIRRLFNATCMFRSRCHCCWGVGFFYALNARAHCSFRRCFHAFIARIVCPRRKLKKYSGVSHLSSSSARFHVDYIRVHTSHVLLRMRTSEEIRSALCRIRGYVDAHWWPPPPRGDVWHCVHHSVLYMLACIVRDGLPIAGD